MRTFVAALIWAALGACLACGSSADEPPAFAEPSGFDNFQTAVAADRNYDIYWLGESFEAGGLVFEGPEVSDFADDVEGGGLGTHYYAPYNRSCCLDLHITMFVRSAWVERERRRAAGPDQGYAVREVEVAGVRAELRTGGSPPSNTMHLLVLDYGDTVVEAVTRSVVPATPSAAQPNPLVDEATFLAVMEQLRPYPE
jgi:hypothetical protein